ncbi:MAG: response regulator transcription factor [Myxococcales bacterium]|nr:response regulator transcription factor [Myxococcales bacterium]
MKILLVEDEPRLLELLAEALRDAGHEVRACASAETALLTVQQEGPFASMLIDWVLPGIDGLTFLSMRRQGGDHTPALIMTARGTVAERVQGLTLGADDYLVKPVAIEELLARIDAITRRHAQQSVGVATITTLGDLTIKGESRALRGPRGEQLLSSREFELFTELATKRHEVISRQALRDAVWGKWISGSANVVDVYVGYVRAKIALTGSRRVVIETVRGSGYSLRVLDEAL